MHNPSERKYIQLCATAHPNEGAAMPLVGDCARESGSTVARTCRPPPRRRSSFVISFVELGRRGTAETLAKPTTHTINQTRRQANCIIIDPKGTIRSIQMNDDQVGRSIDEVKRLIEAFQYADSHEGEVCPANWKTGERTITADQTKKLEFFGKN